MKTLLCILLSICTYGSVIAQAVIIRFEGANNNSNTTSRNYAVDIDSKTFYSFNADETANSNARQLILNNPGIGTHQLAVYLIEGNTTVSNSEKGTAIYSNTFKLRSGYDMVISIRRNGQVSFSEKKAATATTSASTNTALTTTQFDKIIATVKSNWSQTSKANSIKSAITNKANYFTTDQIGELLLLITSEPKRLELAKLSYPKVTDPNNFADVTDLFNSQANKDNIQVFIQSKNPQATASTSSDIYNNGRPPMANNTFNQLLRTVRNQYEQTGKIAVIRDAMTATDNYFTTAQFRQLLPMVTSETERLVLAKLAFARVSDVSNFTTLTNLFTTQANRDELTNYVRYGETSVTSTTNTTTSTSNRTAMSDGNFSKLHLKARLHIRESSTVADVKEALSSKENYFTPEQIRALLTLVGTESERLAIAKLAYHRTTDPANFSQLADLFTTQASIDDLNNYIRNNRS